MEGERFPSELPEALECAGCRYDLRAIIPTEGLIQCPECGRQTPAAHLGTLTGGRSIRYCLKVLCGPTLVSGSLAIIAYAATQRHGILFQIAGLACLICVIAGPPVAALFIARGRFDRRVRGFWFVVAMFGGWLANIMCLFVLSFILNGVEAWFRFR